MRHSRGGFSLIEILVVLAIIAILAALIFPVFAAARGKARATKCMANLKQIGMAIEMYAADYDELYPFAKDAADEAVPQQWDALPYWQAWIPYMPRLHESLDPYIRNRELWHCPSDGGFDELEDSGYPMDARPTCYAKWGASYFYRTEIGFRFTASGNMVDPVATNLIFDGHGSWHGHGLIRHEKRWNILYADGHVKTANVQQFDESWGVPIVSGP